MCVKTSLLSYGSHSKYGPRKWQSQVLCLLFLHPAAWAVSWCLFCPPSHMWRGWHLSTPLLPASYCSSSLIPKGIDEGEFELGKKTPPSWRLNSTSEFRVPLWPIWPSEEKDPSIWHYSLFMSTLKHTEVVGHFHLPYKPLIPQLHVIETMFVWVCQ